MAPRKKANKDKPQPAVPETEAQTPVSPAPRPAVVDLSAYPEIQQNEFLATEAIYPDGFVRLHGRKDAWKNQENLAFRVRLTCLENADIFVKLDFEFAKDYPKVPLKVSLVEQQPQNSKFKSALTDIITSIPRSNLGLECVHEVTGRIDELLNNAEVSRAAKENPFSLEEERARKEAAAALALQKQQDLLQKRQQDETARSEQALATRLESEKKRREQATTSTSDGMVLKREDRSVSVVFAQDFDQFITVQDTLDGKDITFKSVDGRRVLTRRDDKMMVLVTPSVDDKTISCPQLLLKGIILPQTLDTKDNLQQLMTVIEELLGKSKDHRHPNVIALLAYKIEAPKSDTGDWELDVLSEWAQEGSLDNLLQLSGLLTPSRVKDFTLQILEALAFFDVHGFVHPAIHAQNVLICRSGQAVTIKLSDGYGTALRDLVDKARKVKPTDPAAQPFWTAPELNIADSQRTAQTCLWDLGKVILQMILGPDVFDIYTSPGDCLKRRSFAPEVRALLTAMFNTEPKQRPSASKLKGYQFFYNKNSSLFLSDNRSSDDKSRMPNQGSSTMRWEADWDPMEKLGKGGFGTVMKARNINDQGIYAVKIIKAKDSATLAEVRQEVLLLKDLKHPSIVRYYSTWTEREVRPHVNSLTATEDPTEEPEQHARDHRQLSREAPTTKGRYDTNEEADDFMLMNQISSVGGLPASRFESADRLLGGQRGFFAKPDADEGDDDSDDYDNAFNKHGAGDAPENDGTDEDPFERRQSAYYSEENVSFGHNRAQPESNPSQGQRDIDRVLSEAQERDQKSIMYIQMEFCEQKTLKHAIAHGNLDAKPDEMWRLFRAVLDGLRYIHDQGVTHRDLKPENIFLDSYNNPKIGDFGLAIAAFATYGSGSVVGTLLYMAPELLKSHGVIQAAKLGSKVDMYSLGIMFFEMNYPAMNTSNERNHLLEALRVRRHGLPSHFEHVEFQLQGKIILELTDHDPSVRPGAAQLLSRDEIPEPIEDEKLRQRVHYIAEHEPEQLMAWLKGRSDDVLDLAWEHKLKEENVMNPAVVDHVVSELLAVFHRHGAVGTTRQGVFPKAPQYDNPVTLLGHDGLVLQLPVDLTMPFARSIARIPPDYSKNYCFGSTYRPRTTRADGDEPQVVAEVAFDIVSRKTTSLPLKDATAILVLDNVIRTFPAVQASSWTILLNHNDLLDLILSFCRVNKQDFSKVKKLVAGLYLKGFNKEQLRDRWEFVRATLRSESYNIRETSVAALSKFVGVFASIDDVRKQLSKLLSSDETSVADALTTLKRLQDVLKFTQRLQVKTRIAIVPLSTNADGLYPGNLMFQCVHSRTGSVLAAGGRYDNLIRDQQRGIVNATQCRAVGFRLSLSMIASILLQAANPSVKLSKIQSHDRSGKLASASGITSRVDVLVTSFDAASLTTAGLDCLSVLLAGGVSAELTEEVGSMEEIEELYVNDGQYWLVIVKGTGLDEGGRVKVRTPARVEEEMKVGELVAWLGREMGRKGKARK